MSRTAMSRWWKIPAGPVFWMVTVQVAWTITLVAWIIYFVERREELEGWSTLVAGILLLCLLLAGVTVIVIHFGRQVAHNRAVKDFVSTVSHDLRSPLATVKLHLQTLEYRTLSPEQQTLCLATALEELNRLESGIEDILTASRVERGNLRLDKDPVELADFLTSYCDDKGRMLSLHDAVLSWTPPQTQRFKVRADPKLLRQMLDNLIDNALVHGPRGVKIDLGLSERGGAAVIHVSDNGPGIVRSQRKKMFRMFYRAPGHRKHRKGTGLGLFIVASIAKAHSGRAWVDSDGAGKGSTFHVAIPFAKEERNPS
ncbi:MAG TPA: HAMP domain-containing sensor histidine kinase [Polyangiaceae bacterium]|mgnify:FL=1|nr:HAMP domain-containing sensor histidine kinase [Polyangiaceae bacterium]